MARSSDKTKNTPQTTLTLKLSVEQRDRLRRVVESPAKELQAPEFRPQEQTYLDTYEVTIGRFRRFAEAYDGTAPPEGAGANPSIPESGWKTEWDAYLPQGQAELMASLACSNSVDDVWTDLPGGRENNAAQCLNWYTAFAFCIWDGGRLPTEAEWEYAAAGGDENRLYPWGQEEPDDNRMKLECSEVLCIPLDAEDVGSRVGDIARWGHVDTGGGVREWTLDGQDCGGYEQLGGLCDNCACLSDGWKYQRGGRIGTDWTARVALRAPRAADTGGSRSSGVRCAR